MAFNLDTWDMKWLLSLFVFSVALADDKLAECASWNGDQSQMIISKECHNYIQKALNSSDPVTSEMARHILTYLPDSVEVVR